MIRLIGPQEYDELCRRVGAAIHDATPAEAVVAVVSKGDPRLVDFDGREGLHFPGDAEGRYAGYHPRTSEEAIAHLEAARRSGAEFLCLPATTLWWLDHYQGLAGWLGVHCRIVVQDPDTCVLYDLMRVPADASATGEPNSGTGAQLRALLDSLLPEEARVYSIGTGNEDLSAPHRTVTALEGHNAFGLRRMLESAPGDPTFVLLSARDTDPVLDSELEGVLGSCTEAVARREGQCVLFEVRLSRERSRIPRSPQAGDTPSNFETSLDGEAADKLSRQLERLGLSG